MYHQGINANIMSLGGIAIAIGTMIDAGIVMVENAHKHLERDKPARSRTLKSIIADAAKVGRTDRCSTRFWSSPCLLLPYFTPCEAQEGRLFKPLAFTKTYAMAACVSARHHRSFPRPHGVLACARKVSGAEEKKPSEQGRLLTHIYDPILHFVLRLQVASIVR